MAKMSEALKRIAGMAARRSRWALVGSSVLFLAATPALGNDFPTAARVDYVLGCMAVNGQSQLVMAKCACSIDYIADQMSFADYTEIETIKRMRPMPGERASLFRDVPGMTDALDRFQLIQVEADLQCF